MAVKHPASQDHAIYLDYNATTPVDPRVASAIFESLNLDFGNPSSIHEYGESAHVALDRARNQIASLIGATASQIVFTASGSEADALAIRGSFLAIRDGHSPLHMITQITEHPAVLAVCRELEDLYGVAVTYLPVDMYGRVDPVQVEKAIRPETFLISIMHANNETGTIQPIAEIATMAKTHGVLMHSDAAQAIGKIPVNVDDMNVDLLTIVGHKMYAPKGISALYARNTEQLRPIIGGGSQENGLRAGTENVPYAVGFGLAADLSFQNLKEGETGRLDALRHRLESSLRVKFPDRIHVHGHATQRLPNTLNVRIDGVPAIELLAAMPGVATSAGSACHAGSNRPSSVLTAMGIRDSSALSAIRFSLGRWSTEDEIDRAVDYVMIAVQTLNY